MIFIGVIGATGFLCFFTAYRVASPAVVSPFEYSILIWATLNGWIFFDEIPNQRTFVGMILIVCGSIYIFIREKAQDQSIVTEKPLR
jgi:drug/metabolite transporter (DMT)-like permease